MRGFEKDVARLKHYAHAALPETALQQVAPIERRFTYKRRRSFITILGTVIYVVGITALTSRALFHLFETTDYTD
jgi:hypothetical protein